MFNGNKQVKKSRRLRFFHNERVVVSGLAVVLAAVTVFFIFWTPFNCRKLLRPVPENAVIVSSHRNLASCLHNLATNAFFKAPSSSCKPVNIEFLGSSRYIRRIIAGCTILAFVPELEGTKNPALVVTSWSGAWTPLLRLAAGFFPKKVITPLGTCNGRRLWIYAQPLAFPGEKDTDYYFSFAFDEGIFVGCISQDRTGVAELMNIYDGQGDSIANVPECRFFAGNNVVSDHRPEVGGHLEGGLRAPRAVSCRRPNLIWLRLPSLRSRQKKNIFAACSVDKLEKEHLSGSIKIEPAILLKSQFDNKERLAELNRIFGSLPVIVSAFSSDQAADICRDVSPPLYAEKIKSVLTPYRASNNICSLMIFAGDYGGKFGQGILSIPVPAAVLAVSGVESNKTKAAIIDLLGLINRKNRFGLILNPASLSVGQCKIFTLDSGASGLLNTLPIESRPAFAFYKDWLLLASNASTLKKLALRINSHPDRVGNPKSAWFELAQSQKNEAFLWLEPEAGGKALRFALSMLIFMLDRGNQDKPQQANVQLLKGTRSLLENMDYLSDCFIRLESGQDKTIVHFELSRK